MTPDLPAWTPYDPEDPPRLSENGERPGRVVALVAGAKAMAGGWAGEVTLGLAASWGASTGGRVVAADAAFHAPCLHRAADVPLDEGLSDMLLWGGSLQRVARATERVGFVVTAGTPIADGAAALESPRWGEVCEGFRQAGVTLVVLVSASEGGTAAVVEEASDVVLLVAPEEASSSLLAAGHAKVRATVGLATAGPAPAFPAAEHVPPGPDTPEPVVARAEPPREKAGAFEAALRDAIEADAPEGRALEGADDLPYRVSEGPRAAPEVPETTPPPIEPARGRGRIVTLTALLVVLVLAVLVAALLGIVEIPGITKSAEPAVREGTAVLVPAADAPRQAFSVDVGTFDDAGAAAARVARLASAVPGVMFFSEPITQAGLLRHRVLAGPATDAAGAGALAGRLSAALGDDLQEARPVPTPRAFKLGEMRERAAAARRVEVLSGLDIPAYLLEVDYDDGTTRYRVYAGAYEQESECVGLARLLQERGLSASALTERIGRPPGTDS